MNFPYRPKNKGRKRKRTSLRQNSQYVPTDIPFWADISAVSKNTTNPKPSTQTQKTSTKMQNMSVFAAAKTWKNEELVSDLTDDNSPSVPFTEGSTPRQKEKILMTKKPLLNMNVKNQSKPSVMMQTTMKPLLSMGEKTLEKQNEKSHNKLSEIMRATKKPLLRVQHSFQENMKLNKIKSEKADTKPFEKMQAKTQPLLNTEAKTKVNQIKDEKIDPELLEINETKNPLLNVQEKTRDEIILKQELTEKDKEKIDIKPSATMKYSNQESIANKESNKPKQIPVLLDQLGHPKNPNVHFQATVQKIPRLETQGKTKKVPTSTQILIQPQHYYQNVFNIQDPNTLAMNATGFLIPTYELIGPQQVYQNMINVPDPNALAMSRPKGIPLTFLRQQQKLGAIEPQQTYMPVNTIPMYMIPNQACQPTYSQPSTYSNYMSSNCNPTQSAFVNPEVAKGAPVQANPPSGVSTENLEESEKTNEDIRDSSSSPDPCKPGQRRLSAFKRLGPLTQPKKPKLTINLSLDKDQPVREVVSETKDIPTPEIIPVHKRQDILTSTDYTVQKYLLFWPWKNTLTVRRGVAPRTSKTVMLMEQEQMEEAYEKDNVFLQIMVKGYPMHWTKEDVLDTLLENLKGKSFIPCFTEFTPKKCKFLVIRCRTALLALHKLGLCVRKDDVLLNISISKLDLTLKHIDFLPKLVLRKRLSMGHDNETKLSLKAFTLQSDVSHFIYFPLHQINNQMDIVQLKSYVDWKYLIDLDLSNNRITSIEGFDLEQSTPNLKNLDVSYNYIEKITPLLQCRELPLITLKLEGNPLCTDYTNPQYYVKVLKMIFPMLKEIDGEPIVLAGNMPLVKQCFCPADAKEVVEKFLQIFFPILDSLPADRDIIENMYDSDALLTITCRPKLRLYTVYHRFHNLFVHSRNLMYNTREYTWSSRNIIRLFKMWPGLQHDLTTFSVDVMWHTDSTTLVRIGGVVKLTSESLAVDEYLLAFTRTILLHTNNGFEYKIRNDMVYFDKPTDDYAKNAFRITTIPQKKLNISLEAPDECIKESLVNIFIKLTELDRSPSKRCLEEKNWNLKDALSFFITLMKLNQIHVLNDKPVTDTLK